MTSAFEEAMNMKPCGFCRAAWGWDVAICNGHTRAAFLIARGIAEATRTPVGLIETGWFIEDGDAIAEYLAQPNEVVVEKLPDTPAGWHRWSVNGRQFAFNPSWEGFNTPRPIENCDFDDMGFEDVASRIGLGVQREAINDSGARTPEIRSRDKRSAIAAGLARASRRDRT